MKTANVVCLIGDPKARRKQRLESLRKHKAENEAARRKRVEEAPQNGSKVVFKGSNDG